MCSRRKINYDFENCRLSDFLSFPRSQLPGVEQRSAHLSWTVVAPNLQREVMQWQSSSSPGAAANGGGGVANRRLASRQLPTPFQSAAAQQKLPTSTRRCSVHGCSSLLSLLRIVGVRRVEIHHYVEKRQKCVVLIIILPF